MNQVATTVLAVLAALPAPAAAQVERFGEAVEVRRLVVAVRALDRAGTPVRDLVPGDLAAELGGHEVRVEAVDWLGPAREEVPGRAAATVESRPRLVVVLVQVGFEGPRLKGLMRMSLRAEDLVTGLGPDARVALAVFGSHLELIDDFTRDTAELVERLALPDLLRATPTDRRAEEPSLLAHWDAEAARDAATLEQGLVVVGDALTGLGQPSTVLLLGWGIGRLWREGVTLGPDYGRARLALARAGATVVALDVTDADSHSLEVGLQQAAADTGGLYLRTHLFPDAAVERARAMLEGYLEVTLEVPDALVGPQPLEIRSRRRGVRVLAPRLAVLDDGA